MDRSWGRIAGRLKALASAAFQTSRCLARGSSEGSRRLGRVAEGGSGPAAYEGQGMFNHHKIEVQWGGRPLILETGKIARQADGAVLATYGETVVLATVV